MKKLKILHVTEAFGGGILEYFSIFLNQNLYHDHQLFICKRHECGYDFKYRLPASLKIFEIKRRFGLFGNLITFFCFVKNLHKVIKAEGYDLVHLHSAWAGFLGRIVLCFYPGVKTVYTPHGLPFLDKKSKLKSIFYYCIEWLWAGSKSAILACSQGEFEQLKTFRSQTAFINNPAPDLSRFSEVSPSSSKGDLIVLGVGRLCRQKNPELFADIAVCVRGEIENVKFVWVGDGDKKYAQYLRDAGVEVTGWLSKDSVYQYMAKATLVLSTSDWEGLPITLTEALKIGVPVVAKDCVGNVDAVRHGETGFLGSSIDDLVFFTLTIIKSPDLRSDLAFGAISHCRNSFSAQKFSKKLECFYVDYVNTGIVVGEKPRVKIVYIVESLAGGVINSLRIATESLVTRNIDFYIINSVRPDTPIDYANLFDRRVRFFVVDMSLGFNIFRSFFRVYSIISDIRPAIVHLHSSIAGGVGRLIIPFVFSRPKFFYSPRGFYFLKIKGLMGMVYYLVEFLLSRFNCKIVACSKSELDIAVKLRSDSVLVENARPVSVFSDCVKDFNFDGPIVIGTVGRIMLQKNPILFAKMSAALRARNKTASFIWVGSGDHDFQVELENSGVEITGWVTEAEVKRQLDVIDIYVQTAFYEGMPLSVIEAQLAGIPCVVMDVVGSRDVVIHSLTGFIAKDESELISFVNLLMNDPLLRKKMSDHAYEIAKKRFSIERLREDLVSLYSL